MSSDSEGVERKTVKNHFTILSSIKVKKKQRHTTIQKPNMYLDTFIKHNQYFNP